MIIFFCCWVSSLILVDWLIEWYWLIVMYKWLFQRLICCHHIVWPALQSMKDLMIDLLTDRLIVRVVEWFSFKRGMKLLITIDAGTQLIEFPSIESLWYRGTFNPKHLKLIRSEEDERQAFLTLQYWSFFACYLKDEDREGLGRNYVSFFLKITDLFLYIYNFCLEKKESIKQDFFLIF